MPRQPLPLVSDRLRSLVAGGAGSAGGAGRGVGDDLVARLERGWVPVEPGSITLPGSSGAVEEGNGRADGLVVAHPASPGGRVRVPRPPGRHREPAGRRGPAVVTVPVSLRGARVEVSWVGIAAMVIVLAVAALVFAVRVARAESGVAAEPVAASTPLGVVRAGTPSAFGSMGASGSLSSGPSVGGAGGGAAVGTASVALGSSVRGSPAPGSSTIVVHVVGQVAHPGVLTLPTGSRIGDAVTRAGGPLPGADVARLNLAQFLADGEQVFVPRPGEEPPAPLGGAGSAGGSAGGTGSGRAGGVSTAVALVDLNSTDLTGLDTLPGVGPVLAQRILDWRGQHGRFTTVDELGEVSGIGDKLLEQLRPLARV